mmetsp:Transcript_49065/g.141041  ORF Transcript_49065/g.141041 Transcript_49065/m.141041 type:complete len:226 (-) Transcript_49065:357-1034(-)
MCSAGLGVASRGVALEDEAPARAATTTIGPCARGDKGAAAGTGSGRGAPAATPPGDKTRPSDRGEKITVGLLAACGDAGHAPLHALDTRRPWPAASADWPWSTCTCRSSSAFFWRRVSASKAWAQTRLKAVRSSSNSASLEATSRWIRNNASASGSPTARVALQTSVAPHRGCARDGDCRGRDGSRCSEGFAAPLPCCCSWCGAWRGRDGSRGFVVAAGCSGYGA